MMRKKWLMISPLRNWRLYQKRYIMGMENEGEVLMMPTKAGRFVYWAPRILAILFVLFLAMFSLDVIEPGRSVGEIVVGMLMHNIPVFTLIALLIIAWKHELVGVITFSTAGLLYMMLTVSEAIRSEVPWYVGITWGLTLGGPALLVGILFLVSWSWKRKRG